MADLFVKFTGKINRRLPQDEGDPESPLLRENWLARDKCLRRPKGHELVTGDLSDKPRWITRYYSLESSIVSPKTFVYTKDGKISVLSETSGSPTVVKEILKTDAFPRSWLFKTTGQVKLFFVDGEFLYQHDGNNANLFLKVTLQDADGNSVNPIDVIEHKDRLCVISKTSLFISKNLDPENFTDADDSLEVIVGSGKGLNLSFGKIEDKLYIFNTEGIFVLDGDVISALASTFEVRLVDDRKIIASRSAVTVEKAIVFLADDYELWAFDGTSSKMLTYDFRLKDFVNKYQEMVAKATAIYHDNYYKLSFVETGSAEPNLEIWWDALEDNVDIVRGRNVSCYMKTEATQEEEYVLMGQANANKIVRDERGYNFLGSAIATRLRTRDITPEKGKNVRFMAFYPQFMPTGDRNLLIRYLLDGRSSNPTGSEAQWFQNLRGEVKTVGMISVSNQAQFSGRVRPKINYARGESIAFEIIDSTLDMKSDFLGMGIDFLAKEKSKGKTIGA